LSINIQNVLRRKRLGFDDITGLLSVEDPLELKLLRKAAESVLIKECGNRTYFRGLVEFSNLCACDCYYCGIRKGNGNVHRYQMTKEQILAAARQCAALGYGSIVLQSGERRDRTFTDFVTDAVSAVKGSTRSEALPDGLGITLSMGEQDITTFRRFRDAGAHRYLLRIETSSPALFRTIHPQSQTFESRRDCLHMLKDAGFQVGTGVMIGIPGQTIRDLARDILFFRDMDADMIGMGPYLIHPNTPMAIYREEIARRRVEIFRLALKMIAVTRLALRDINIASATAFQAMSENGYEQALLHGANVIMPQLTPAEFRHEYLLYEGKPVRDESAEQYKTVLERRIISLGRIAGYDSWGDSLHFLRNSNYSA